MQNGLKRLFHLSECFDFGFHQVQMGKRRRAHAAAMLVFVGHRQQPAASDVDVVNPAAEEQSNNGITNAQTSAAEQ